MSFLYLKKKGFKGLCVFEGIDQPRKSPQKKTTLNNDICNVLLMTLEVLL